MMVKNTSKTNKKVLIIEDDKSFLWILKQSFFDEGFLVIFAENGEEGLAMAEKENPDLIVLDIVLPRMDGISVAKKIKEKNIGCKILFLTNLKDTDHISQAMEIVGNADYIIKSDLSIDQIIKIARDRLRI